VKKDIILIGGGGHCRSCIDVIEAGDEFKIAGIVDKREKLSQEVLGYKIIACDEDLQKLTKDYKYFLITIGQIKDAAVRMGKYTLLKKLGAIFPVIISPSAYIAKTSFIDEGTIIMHNAFVNAQAVIGKNCIINTAAIIEHDVKIEDHCHISTGVVINGNSMVGQGSFVGSRSVVSHDITIKSETVIGAGSSVIRSIDRSGTYAGNPATRLDKHE